MLGPNSILDASVFHERLQPTSHKFRYNLFYLRLRVDQLTSTSNELKYLKYNQKGLLSLWDRDYLSHFSGTLLEKITKLLNDLGFESNILKVEIVTHPRLLGYVFNPVSFFLCHRQDPLPDILISEVHNTFGEAHVYVCEANKFDGEAESVVGKRFKAKKCFHVSPFFSREGEYEFEVVQHDPKLAIFINLIQDGVVVFKSGIVTKAKVLSDASIIRALATLPLSILLTIPRITWQAAILKFRKKLPVFTRPIAIDKLTFKIKNKNLSEKIWISLFKKFLKKADYGTLNLEFPGGYTEVFQGVKDGTKARIRALNYDFFRNSLLHGDIGFGESYVAKHWDTDDLTKVLRFFAQNLGAANDRSIFLSYFGRIKNAFCHYSRKNSLKGSRKNISAHYDLSNDLFRTFLDKRMQYSSALFKSNAESLEEAQLNKIIEIEKLSKINGSHHLLEIGCGWGGLGLELVKRSGCNYTGITLSQEQKAYFEERIREEKLEDRMRVELKDYRNLTGSYDRIISVEMVEAVGHRYLAEYFRICNEVLKPGGNMVVQAITIPEARYKAYKYGCDWIQKHIFPGGHCPSLNSLIEAASKSSLVLKRTRNIAESYAETLKKWREVFNENNDEVFSLGFDEKFSRIWNYYLAYCESGFRENLVDVHQITFSKVEGGSVSNAKSE